MNFGFTEEQDMLRSEVRKFLDAKASMEEVRRIMESADAFDEKLWAEMAELGWLGLLIPEEMGGAGLGWVDLTVVLEECGRTLFPSPFLASTLCVIALHKHATESQQREWLPRIADGTLLFSAALLESDGGLHPASTRLAGRRDGNTWTLNGHKAFVPDATVATHFLVPFRKDDAAGAIGWAIVERDSSGVTVENTPSIDLTKRFGSVHFDDVTVTEERILGGADSAEWESLERLLDHAAAAVTAEAVGAAEGAHALIVQYAKQRVQFGSTIGRYQGVKHPLAEMYVDIESFKSLLYYAAWCLDENPSEAPLYVSMAKAWASDAFTRIGIDGIELHGALGYTWEYDAQLYLKRSKWVKSAFGGSDYHYDRIASVGGL